ncbi:MAG: 3-isopropylmalate dehydratase small subunit, partial [Sedimentisphaerales bacterium]|nr:3-isopropylmalate dehydratase small subunit [Sedimentisphaerales bacterium]
HVYKKDNINTDEIIPARFLNTDDEAELAKHCMEDLDEEFVRKVSPGDFIVAGSDFGCGSSREHAVWSLRGAGVAAVLADSFARIFYRNAINCGFLVVEAPGISEKINNGDKLDIDSKNGKITNLTSGETYEFTPLPDFALDIIEAGGLLNKIS